jgi:tetratricopeptide (TPR) repeat protein
LQEVVTSDPDNAVAHYELGRAYVISRRADSREAARQQYELAIAKRPDMIQPKLGLASLEVTHGEYQAALDMVRDILRTDPNNFNARLIESQAYLGQKKYGESDALLNGMMKSNNNSTDVFYQAGMNAMAQGKPDAAAGAFMRAYQLNPANSKALLGVVDADIQLGKPDAAMTVLTAESKKNPNRLDVVFLMGTTAQRAGKLDDALGYFNKFLNGLSPTDPTRADAFLQIANIYRFKNDRGNAIAFTQKASAIKPDNEQILIDLGMLLSQAGRQADAKQAYQAALKVGPNNIRTLNELAYLLAETNSELDQALNCAQRAKSLAPNNPDISDTLAWVMLKKKLTDQAILTFKDLASHYPANATYLYHLAAAYKERGDNAKTLEEAKEALKHNPAPDEQARIQQLISSSGGK